MVSNKINKKFVAFVLVVFFVCLYFIVPPRDKIAQIGYIFNNLRYTFASKTVAEYVFYRNNAVYMARMNNPKIALAQIDKAIGALPYTEPDEMLYNLYRDRATIKMYYEDYKGALNDYLRVKNLGINDYLKVAMLLKEVGKRNMAVSYCNKIIDYDIKAYAGYACIADVYASAGKYEAAAMIYDLLLDRVPNHAKSYADRAMYKEKGGDLNGAKEDYKKAKELSPNIDLKSSITYDAIHVKNINLPIL